MVAYKSLKTKKKSSWVIQKVVAVAYGSGHLRELFITKFKSQFKWDFAKVVVTRAGRLQERLQGELRLYGSKSIQTSLILRERPSKPYQFCCKILSCTYYLKEAEMKITLFAHFNRNHKNFTS